MASLTDNDSGFSESDIRFARQTFFRDCPNGRCSKQKFLTFIKKSSLQKPIRSKIHLIKTLHNYRHSKKFFSMMFDIYDRNHDGELDFDEYIYALSAITGANVVRTLETLFAFFDIHNQGYIMREEFNSRKKLVGQFLGQYKTGIKNNFIYERAFNAMDLDKDGRISKEDFIQWHLKDHFKLEETKPTTKRPHLLRNLSALVDSRDQNTTSPLQQENKNSIDIWLNTSMNVNSNQELPSTVHADQYLLKVFRRARDRFHHEKTKINDNQSESGVFTSSSITTFTDDDFDSNSLLDVGEYDFQSIPTDDTDSELLCQSLETVLMETLLELRQHRKQLSNNHTNTVIKEDEQALETRF